MEDLGKIQEILAQLSPGNSGNSNKEAKESKKNPGKDRKDKDCINLTPSQLLVIAGFISGALEVESVLVDKAQRVEIVLTGTLKRKTQLEMIMEQVGQMPFEEVVRAIMNSS